MAKKTPPTFEQRLTAAQTEASAALSVFDGIISDLEGAATTKEALSEEIYGEIERLNNVVDDLYALMQESTASAVTARQKADSIRTLMGN